MPRARTVWQEGAAGDARGNPAMNIPDEHIKAIEEALHTAISATLNAAGWSESRGLKMKRFKAALVALQQEQERVTTRGGEGGG